MAKIIAARFETQSETEGALTALLKAGIRRDKLSIFQVLPPGQHATHPAGGDALHDRGTRKSVRGAIAGIAAGAFAGALAGWLIADALYKNWNVGALVLGTALGAAIGAYIGSLFGALVATRRPNPARASPEFPVSRKSGPLIAAEVGNDPERLAAACDVFVGMDALEVEAADGTIRDGDWVDFDPRLPPRIIAPIQRSAAANTISRPREHA